MARPHKSPFGISLATAFRGVLEAFANERNLRIQIVVAIITVAAGVYFQVSRVEWLMIVFCIGLVTAAEVFNTAFESVVNLLQPEIHEDARRSKDFAAGAVLICSMTAGLVGAAIFLPHFLEMF